MVILEVILLAMTLVGSTQGRIRHQFGGSFQGESCNTELTDMDIVRQMTVIHNGVQKSVNCIARIRANECEGVCLSKVSPNVNMYPDFKKDCKCCKEGRLITREITLQECYDGGEKLEDLTPTTMITEPADCSCQTCRN